MNISRHRLEAALESEIRKNGPVLLWSGDGKIPGNFRGLIPMTLYGFLQRILPATEAPGEGEEK